MLEKLKKWVCRALCQVLVWLIGFTFLQLHQSCLNCFHFLIFMGCLLVILLGCCFDRILRNCLPIECFYLGFGLKYFQTRVIKYLTYLGFLKQDVFVCHSSLPFLGPSHPPPPPPPPNECFQWRKSQFSQGFGIQILRTQDSSSAG